MCSNMTRKCWGCPTELAKKTCHCIVTRRRPSYVMIDNNIQTRASEYGISERGEVNLRNAGLKRRERTTPLISKALE